MNKERPHKIFEDGKEVWLTPEEYCEYKGLTNEQIYGKEKKKRKPFWKIW